MKQAPGNYLVIQHSGPFYISRLFDSPRQKTPGDAIAERNRINALRLEHETVETVGTFEQAYNHALTLFAPSSMEGEPITHLNCRVFSEGQPLAFWSENPRELFSMLEAYAGKYVERERRRVSRRNFKRSAELKPVRRFGLSEAEGLELAKATNEHLAQQSKINLDNRVWELMRAGISFVRPRVHAWQWLHWERLHGQDWLGGMSRYFYSFEEAQANKPGNHYTLYSEDGLQGYAPNEHMKTWVPISPYVSHVAIVHEEAYRARLWKFLRRHELQYQEVYK